MLSKILSTCYDGLGVQFRLFPIAALIGALTELQMQDRENVPNCKLRTPSFPPPEDDDSEWWGWPLVDLLVDVPEMLIKYLFVKIRRQVLAPERLFQPMNSDERGRNRERV